MNTLKNWRIDITRKWKKISFLIKGLFLYVFFTPKKTQPLKPPVLIVGCGHSGTTLLLAMLASHSEMYDIPFESHVFRRQKFWTNIFLASFNQWAKVAKKQRWIEKTPKHIDSISRIFKYYPNAKVVVVRRDGRDVANSIKKRTGDLQFGIKRWVDDNAQADKFLSHKNVIFVKYEELIVGPEETLRQLCEFIGIDYEPTMLNYHQTERAYYSKKIKKPKDASAENHDTYRTWQINQPLFDNRGKWKNLSEQERSLFKKLAGEKLIEYEYVKSHDW